MGIVRRSLVLVVALALSGCWLEPGFGPERQNFNPLEDQLTGDNVASLHQVWSTAWDTGGPPLVAADNSVYTGGLRRGSDAQSSFFFTVRAANRTTGAPLWQRDVGSFGSAAPAAANIGTILSVGDDEVLTATVATLQKLDPATGATTASLNLGSKLVNPAGVVANDDVIAGRQTNVSDFSSNLVVWRRDDFAVLWTAPLSTFDPLNESDDQVLIAGGRIYVHDNTPAGSVINAYDLNGCGAATCSPASVTPVPPPSTGQSTGQTRPLAVTDDGHVLLSRPSFEESSGNHAELVALSSDGTSDWTFPLASLAGVAAAGDTVFAVGNADPTAPGNHLFALRAGTGDLLWQSEGTVDGLTPIAAGGLVYDGGTVFAAAGCGAAVCPPVAAVDLGPGGSPYGESVAAGTLYVNRAGPDGHLTALQPTN